MIAPARLTHADHEECIAPVEMMGHHAGDIASAKTAQNRARNIRSHGAAYIGCAKFLADVGHHDDDYAGHEQPLHEAPEDELVKILRGRRQQRRNGDRIQGRNDDLLAADDSARSPMNGAVSATARIVALTVKLTAISEV